jgi:hypothetical protein
MGITKTMCSGVFIGENTHCFIAAPEMARQLKAAWPFFLSLSLSLAAHSLAVPHRMRPANQHSHSKAERPIPLPDYRNLVSE